MRVSWIAVILAAYGCGDGASECVLEGGTYLATTTELGGDCQTEDPYTILVEGGVTPFFGRSEECTGPVVESDDRCEVTYDRVCGTYGYIGSFRITASDEAVATHTYWQEATEGFGECSSSERVTLVRQ